MLQSEDVPVCAVPERPTACGPGQIGDIDNPIGRIRCDCIGTATGALSARINQQRATVINIIISERATERETVRKRTYAGRVIDTFLGAQRFSNHTVALTPSSAMAFMQKASRSPKFNPKVSKQTQHKADVMRRRSWPPWSAQLAHGRRCSLKRCRNDRVEALRYLLLTSYTYSFKAFKKSALPPGTTSRTARALYCRW